MSSLGGSSLAGLGPVGPTALQCMAHAPRFASSSLQPKGRRPLTQVHRGQHGSLAHLDADPAASFPGLCASASPVPTLASEVRSGEDQAVSVQAAGTFAMSPCTPQLTCDEAGAQRLFDLVGHPGLLLNVFCTLCVPTSGVQTWLLFVNTQFSGRNAVLPPDHRCEADPNPGSLVGSLLKRRAVVALGRSAHWAWFP